MAVSITTQLDVSDDAHWMMGLIGTFKAFFSKLLIYLFNAVFDVFQIKKKIVLKVEGL